AAAPFYLKSPTTFHITCSSLDIPLMNPLDGSSLKSCLPRLFLDISKIKTTINGKNEILTLSDANSQEIIDLAHSTFTINKIASNAPIQLTVASAVTSQKSGNTTLPIKSGALNGSIAIDNLLNPQGSIDLENIQAKTTLTFSQFPSKVLDILARVRGNTQSPFSALFGETINMDAQFELNKLTGPISLTLNSPNSRASFKGKLVKGALVLDTPLHLQGMITKELSRLLLKEVNPLSISYIYSSDPVTLEISKTDFYLPLIPFDPQKSQISHARIELGQIHCRNEGNIQTTLNLLKNKQFSKEKEIMLWFAPLDLQVYQGIVSIERTEILIAENFDIAIWGKFNMVKDYVDMLLGLTSQTLRQAFGIKGLPEDYVLTLPMKGPSDNVKIDTGKATAKIAMLLAWQQKALSGAVGGGTAGAIVGEFLGKLATLPDKDVKIPPAKHPFPWEVGKRPYKKTSTEKPSGKKKHFKVGEKPLKQLLKVIR
ncbi:MAG: hypothetical protein HYZ48_05750, partial [Chlamydiales bacterium]|nr:hypothetical protein [Chlamydiales bacterium]